MKDFYVLATAISVFIGFVCVPIVIICFFEFKKEQLKNKFEREKFYFEKGLKK